MTKVSADDLDSRSTPLTTRNRLEGLAVVAGDARYSPSARITRGKAPIDSLITSPPGSAPTTGIGARPAAASLPAERDDRGNDGDGGVGELADLHADVGAHSGMESP